MARPGLLLDPTSLHMTALLIDGVVAELGDVLGAKLIAHVAGLSETRAVRDWAEGTRSPRSPVPERLRLALRWWRSARTRQCRHRAVWLQGLNARLEDRSPARLLRDGDL